MADGSYQRITLFPQAGDGTYTVRFENEYTQSEETQKAKTLSDEIDRIICRNNGILASSKMGIIRKTERQPVSLLKSSRYSVLKPPILPSISPRSVVIPNKVLDNTLAKKLKTKEIISVPVKSSLRSSLNPNQCANRNITTGKGVDQTNKIKTVNSRIASPALSTNVETKGNASPVPADNTITLMQNGNSYHRFVACRIIGCIVLYPCLGLIKCNFRDF